MSEAQLVALAAQGARPCLPCLPICLPGCLRFILRGRCCWCTCANNQGAWQARHSGPCAPLVVVRCLPQTQDPALPLSAGGALGEPRVADRQAAAACLAGLPLCNGQALGRPAAVAVLLSTGDPELVQARLCTGGASSAPVIAALLLNVCSRVSCRNVSLLHLPMLVCKRACFQASTRCAAAVATIAAPAAATTAVVNRGRRTPTPRAYDSFLSAGTSPSSSATCFRRLLGACLAQRYPQLAGWQGAPGSMLCSGHTCPRSAQAPGKQAYVTFASFK